MPHNEDSMTAEAVPGHVASTEGLGVCVIVGGQVIAWFRYGDQAKKWATKHYFGRWLMRTPVAKPEPAPWSDSEIAQIRALADDMRDKCKEPRIADA